MAKDNSKKNPKDRSLDEKGWPTKTNEERSIKRPKGASDSKLTGRGYQYNPASGRWDRPGTIRQK